MLSILLQVIGYLFCFFFNDTATTEIYTLSLHDALPIWPRARSARRVPHRTPGLSHRAGGGGARPREARRDSRHDSRSESRRSARGDAREAVPPPPRPRVRSARAADRKLPRPRPVAFHSRRGQWARDLSRPAAAPRGRLLRAALADAARLPGSRERTWVRVRRRPVSPALRRAGGRLERDGCRVRTPPRVLRPGRPRAASARILCARGHHLLRSGGRSRGGAPPDGEEPVLPRR